jgi:plastocyanin
MQKNHTATQSSFANPCSAVPGGFDSGLYVPFPFLSPSSSLIPSFSVPVSDNNTNGPFQQAQFQVTDTNPVWVYCRQTGHCQMGMVFAINPGEKFAAFQAAAMGNTTTNSSSSASPAASSGTPSTTASSTSPSSTSNDHRVIVGGTTLIFEPSNITAQPGDTITFEFHQKNHTVTQSSFANPCQMLASNSTSGQVGFDSGLYVLFLSSFLQPTSRSRRTIRLACLSVPTPPRSLRTPSR